MRWIWIDRFTDFRPGRSATAVKCVTSAEEHLTDLFPAFPVYPHSLIVEGMAQTAGILVGHAQDYRQKVILAKIGKAEFHRLVRPGDVLTFAATADVIHDGGASVTGSVSVGDRPVADISLVFSHIDQNLAGVEFPPHNFVFGPHFRGIIEHLLRDVDVTL